MRSNPYLHHARAEPNSASDQYGQDADWQQSNQTDGTGADISDQGFQASLSEWQNDSPASSIGGPSPGALPLVGDLGLIYQVPTPGASSPGGSSGGSVPSPVSSGSSSFVIDVTYDSSVSNAPAGFTAAIQDAVTYLESVITAPITVNIDVGYGEIDGQALQSGALGESETYLNSYSYSSIVAALKNINPSAAASLPTSAPGTMWIGTAEAKALGLAGASSDIDGYAGFSSVYPFTYNPNDRAVSGEYDFIGVVEHEFTEDMGRIDLFGDDIGGASNSYSLLDLYHYASDGVHTYTGTTTNYFSANGGETALDYFNSNPDGDLGDWASSAGDDSFLAFSPSGEEDSVSQSDITVMNALGYQTGTAVSTATGTTAVMITSDGGGDFAIYDLGNNSILSSDSLLQTAAQWQFAGMGDFYGADTNDVLLRSDTTGALELYEVSNNSVSGSAAMGQVGLEWSVAGFGNFSGNTNETDMLMRDNNNGALELYDISNGQYTGFYGMGQVGLEWTFVGTGDFSGVSGASDFLMRNSNTGAFELYDVADNQYTGYYALGAVSLNWSVAGLGDFSGKSDETDMLMRNNSTGAFALYDISNNQLSNPIAMGQVGLEWSVVGFGDISGNANETDMLMRDNNNGALELYDINNNTYAGYYSIGTVSTQLAISGVGGNGAEGAASQLAQAAAAFAPNTPSASTGVNTTIQNESATNPTLLAGVTNNS
jgi:hypothetical protein